MGIFERGARRLRHSAKWFRLWGARVVKLAHRLVLKLSLLIATAAVLAGCAIVDQYSSRAVAYNLEAEDALGQGLLLNVVRAALRRPMQFTSVQSISGTASANGSANIFIPFGAGGAAYKTGTFNGSVSGGPTFAVPVLDTQEFYQGVTSPVSGRLFDFFIHEEFPREEIYTLFIQKIIIRKESSECNNPPRHTGDCELTFVNYPGSDLDFDLTQSTIEHFLNLGLTTEPIGGSSNAGAGGSKSGDSKSGDSTGEPTLQYRFCFAPKFPQYNRDIVRPEYFCGYEKPVKGGAATEGPSSDPGHIAKKSTFGGVRLSSRFIDNLIYIADQTRQRSKVSEPEYERLKHYLNFFRGSIVSFTVYTRSTEGILYFLGEVVRRYLYPETDPLSQAAPRIFQIKIETSFNRQYSELPCYLDPRPPGSDYYPFRCENFFVLDHELGLSPLWVHYNGRNYSVPNDPAVAGKTLHVLSIVKQLLALHTSAKALPQTSVLGIIVP
jgi:hypothetical protein